MQAVAEEYPGHHDLLLLHEQRQRHGDRAGRPAARRWPHRGYGLYPAMIDGWLDAAPPTVDAGRRLRIGLPLQQPAAVPRGGASASRGPARSWSRRRTGPSTGPRSRSSFGIYLDAYWNPKDSPWYIDGLGGSARRAAAGQRATAPGARPTSTSGSTARSSAGGPRRTAACAPETWPEALPGCERALRLRPRPAGLRPRRRWTELKPPGKLREPGPQRRLRLRHGGGSQRRDRDSAARAARPPAGVPGKKTSKGTFTWDRPRTAGGGQGAARRGHVTDGCFIQSVSRPGRRALRRRRHVPRVGQRRRVDPRPLADGRRPLDRRDPR